MCCLGLFRFVSNQFVSNQFVSVVLNSIPKQWVSIEPKQTEDQPKQFDREHILVFFRKFRVVLVCFGFIRNSSVCFGCFDIGSKHRSKPKILVFGFTKQNRNKTETKPKQILFRFVSVRTEFFFCRFEDTLAKINPKLADLTCCCPSCWVSREAKGGNRADCSGCCWGNRFCCAGLVVNWGINRLVNKNKILGPYGSVHNVLNSSCHCSDRNQLFYGKRTCQGVTKRCNLSWLTNSALVEEPKCGGKAGGSWGVSANEYSCTQEPNFITYGTCCCWLKGKVLNSDRSSRGACCTLCTPCTPWPWARCCSSPNPTSWRSVVASPYHQRNILKEKQKLIYPARDFPERLEWNENGPMDWPKRTLSKLMCNF